MASTILTAAGLKFAEAPAGKPVTLRFTRPVKLADGVIVTVYCATAVRTTERNAGVTPTSEIGRGGKWSSGDEASCRCNRRKCYRHYSPDCRRRRT